jgi:hypothetical protein
MNRPQLAEAELVRLDKAFGNDWNLKRGHYFDVLQAWNRSDN